MPVTENKWGPYSNAGDFTTNTVITVVVLLCGLLLGLAINVAIRFLLCARRSRGLAEDPEKQAGARKEAITLPTLLLLTWRREIEFGYCRTATMDFTSSASTDGSPPGGRARRAGLAAPSRRRRAKTAGGGGAAAAASSSVSPS